MYVQHGAKDQLQTQTFTQRFSSFSSDGWFGQDRPRDMDSTLWSHTVPGAEPGETVK